MSCNNGRIAWPDPIWIRKVPEGAIEAAISALSVKSIIMFVGDMLDPFGAEYPPGPTDDIIPKDHR